MSAHVTHLKEVGLVVRGFSRKSPAIVLIALNGRQEEAVLQPHVLSRTPKVKSKIIRYNTLIEVDVRHTPEGLKITRVYGVVQDT